MNYFVVKFKQILYIGYKCYCIKIDTRLIITKIKKDLEKRTSENANAIAINELAEESKTTLSGEISHIMNSEKQRDQIEKFARDNRLNHLNVPQGLIESLNQGDFTIDRILYSTP